MPEISRFFGVIIRMYTKVSTKHNLPHFHAYYQENVAIYGIESIELLARKLPLRQQRLVEAWTELHQRELFANWERLQNGQAPKKIIPLS